MSACPYCMAEIEPGDAVVVCGMCNWPHHAECWAQNTGCCVKACPDLRRIAEIDLPPDTRERLVLSREAVESTRSHRPERVTNPCLKCGKQVPEGELYCAECEPSRPENQDAKNLGPILLMLLVAALVIGWLVIGSMSVDDDSPLLQTHIEDKSDQR